MNVKYERVVCINLDRRPEKWKQFQDGLPQDFPFGTVERYPAIDGKKVPRPDWWKGGGGAWGCYLTHRRIIEECLNTGINSVLIFEDDALFCEDFTAKVENFHESLPSDAQWIYYGGQHLKRAVKLPEKINEQVYRPYNVNRTHAYGIVGKIAMVKILQHLNRRNWNTPHHIDHWLGRLHESGTINVYCPDRWLVDQRGGESDVAGRIKKTIHWKDAVVVPNLSGIPYYAILGCHSSGSSALAGALYHLGIHLGNKLVGMYGRPPINGGEAIGLRNIYEQAYPIPATECKFSESLLLNKLRQFVNRRRIEANSIGTVSAGKYPQMALSYGILKEILQEDLRVIWIDRNINESILSLQKRFPNISAKLISNHQRAIYNNSKRAYEENGNFAMRVLYDDLLNNPSIELGRVAKFMNLNPSKSQMELATSYIQAGKRHIKL